jgi:hypothetical protein
MIRSTLALAAVLSTASTSLAADLVTPRVFVGANTNAVCKLANITSAPLPAQLQMISGSGTVLLDSGPRTVDPVAVTEILLNHAHTAVYCRFVKASKSTVRATVSAFIDADDETDHILAAAQ